MKVKHEERGRRTKHELSSSDYVMMERLVLPSWSNLLYHHTRKLIIHVDRLLLLFMLNLMKVLSSRSSSMSGQPILINLWETCGRTAGK